MKLHRAPDSKHHLEWRDYQGQQKEHPGAAYRKHKQIRKQGDKPLGEPWYGESLPLRENIERRA